MREGFERRVRFKVNTCMTHCAIVVFIKSIKVEGYFTTFSGDAVADRVGGGDLRLM